uniref:Ankyrin repeat-containing protein n=1 Tax=Trepomonas sp. PC1 TaxID=1076344 RepID=A0A146K4H2_9EUKA|eukprot:JAP91803.1 Ankyrin repeat-containing protein [Trepomonas sp. PC1]
MLKQAEVEFTTPHSPLLAAIRNKNKEMVQELIQYQTGSEVHECIKNNMPQMIRYFKDQKSVDKRGNTSLMMAVDQNNYLVAKQFLHQLGMQNNAGKTALMLAMEFQYIQFYEMLKSEAGKIDNHMKCAYAYATEVPRWIQSDLFEREKLVIWSQREESVPKWRENVVREINQQTAKERVSYTVGKIAQVVQPNHVELVKIVRDEYIGEEKDGYESDYSDDSDDDVW